MKSPLGFILKQTEQINPICGVMHRCLIITYTNRHCICQKEASGTDMTNVSILTIEVWQVLIYCTCRSQLVPFIIYRYITLVTFYMQQ